MSNNQMTKTEEIRLHNLFIKFKNEGKGIDEIKGLLKVEDEIIEKWDADFEEEINNINKNESSVKTEITGIGEDGGFLYNSSFSFNLSELEYAKFKMQNLIWSINEDSELKEYRIYAIKYLPIFEKHFISLNIKIDEKDERKASIEFHLNTNDIATNQLAKEAAEFYAQILSIEKEIYKSYLINELTSDYFNSVENILPYSLKSFKAKNYEGIKNTGFKGLPIDTNWIFLIGENGFGKTTLLRSISIGFIGKKDEESELFISELPDQDIGIEYFSLSHSIINNVTGREFTQLLHLACYGPSRLQIQTDQTKNDVAKKSTTTYSLFNSDGILLNIEYSLLIWFLKEDSKFESVKKVFKKLIPYLEDIEVTDKEEIFYIEKEPTENGSKYNRVTFNQLASGFRSILAMVGDMMIRLFKSQPEITEPSELAGIVIIDELDLHWHPKMQREVPSLLSSIFPKVQFIASTHSLVPLLGAPENSVLLKVNRTVEEGITVEKVDIDFQALSSDTMLRDIFDLEEYMSDSKIKAWERYTKLKGLIHFEKDEAKKNEYIHEREILGDKYNFTL
jgi:AAA domain, putative AbiEii toxin, Type IV TA system